MFDDIRTVLRRSADTIWRDLLAVCAFAVSVFGLFLTVLPAMPV